MSISSNEFFHEDAGSDSDTISDSPNDYHPISAFEDSEDEEINGGNLNPVHSSEFDTLSFENPHFHRLDNGISHLDLNGNGEISDSEEEEEEKIREVSESAISRAFNEDEGRRNAPLAAETSVRVMDAMRGVSFVGVRPDWADQVPEDRWVDHLRRLREPTTQN